MQIDQALRAGTRRLAAHSSTPRLDSELLLGHLLHMSRAALLARPADELDEYAQQVYQALLARRERGEPVAYLTGHKEFYGLELLITKDVLVPRPETESVVSACLEALRPAEFGQLADVGTGSGAIAVSVAVNRPNVRVFATDVSPKAIDVAHENCLRHGVEERVELSVGNLLEPLPGRVNVIAANLPYVPAGEASPEVATWEPRLAVFGGSEDGTGIIEQFLAQAPDYLLPGGTVIMETAYSQGSAVSDLARQAFPQAEIEIRKDLASYDRLVIIRQP